MKTCNNCNSTNITHEEKQGRVLPPKNYKGDPIRRISCKGIWDIWACNDCNNIVKKLRR